jgi:hypothetical protein
MPGLATINGMNGRAIMPCGARVQMQRGIQEAELAVTENKNPD